MSGKNRSIKIDNEPIFTDFCVNHELKNTSVHLYKYALRKYSNFTNKSLEELIEEAEAEEDSVNRLRKRKINKYLQNFKASLDESDLAESSKKHIIMLVKAFYREFDIELPKSKRRKSRKSTNAGTIADLPTMEEIQLFMEHCSSAYKAIIVTSISSGMSRAEIASLTFKNLFDAISLKTYPESLREIVDILKNTDSNILFWNVKRIKTGNDYFTFSSPESLDRITIYLEELRYRNPDYKPKLDDKLFRFVPNNKPLSADTIGNTFYYINSHHGFRKVNERYVVRNHNLRKYFATTLEKNKVPHLFTRWMLGHSIDSVTNAYFKPDPEKIKQDYLNVVNELTTNKVEIKVINKYEEIKHDINAIKEDLDAVKSKKGLILESGKIPSELLDYIQLVN
jgi:integrase